MRRWLLVLPSLLMAIVVALAAGCGSGTEPELLRMPSIAGRYEGLWGVVANDTVETCGQGGEKPSCGFAQIEILVCHFVVDVTQQGNRFSGTFVVDSGGVYSSCQSLKYLNGKRPAMTGEIRNGVIDSVEPGAALHFTIGQGGPEELERLVGCRLANRLAPWAIDAWWIEAGTSSWAPSWGNALSARSHGSTPRTTVRFECGGRRMDIEITFTAWDGAPPLPRDSIR